VVCQEAPQGPVKAMAHGVETFHLVVSWVRHALIRFSLTSH